MACLWWLVWLASVVILGAWQFKQASVKAQVNSDPNAYLWAVGITVFNSVLAFLAGAAPFLFFTAAVASIIGIIINGGWFWYCWKEFVRSWQARQLLGQVQQAEIVMATAGLAVRPAPEAPPPPAPTASPARNNTAAPMPIAPPSLAPDDDDSDDGWADALANQPPPFDDDDDPPYTPSEAEPVELKVKRRRLIRELTRYRVLNDRWERQTFVDDHALLRDYWAFYRGQYAERRPQSADWTRDHIAIEHFLAETTDWDI